STRRLTKPGEFTASPGRLPQPHAGNACELDTGMVWALPRSLATTKGISVDFFSSRYEDVSIPALTPVRLWIHRTVTGHSPRRVSPFGHPRIDACLRLPEAYRSLPRPSSARSAKASAVCPS